IHELGLIYGVEVSPAGAVAVRMTLTAAGCPAAQVLPAEVERRVRDVPGVTDVCVEVTFDPPWDQSRMSEAARLQLGFLSSSSPQSASRSQHQRSTSIDLGGAPAARGEEQPPAHDEGQCAHRGHEDPRMLFAQKAARERAEEHRRVDTHAV